MAGVVPALPPRTGCMSGKLEVEAERFITLGELCTHLPEVKEFLEEISGMGRRYLLIDAFGKVLMQLNIETAEYKWQSYEHARGGFAYNLFMDFGRRLPKLVLTQIISLDRLVLNISSNDFARGVTLDLHKKEITFVHDCLWVAKGEGCAKEAKDTLKILRWLVEDKKFNLAVDGGKKQYREMVALLGGK